jgi:hypothetical protein
MKRNRSRILRSGVHRNLTGVHCIELLRRELRGLFVNSGVVVKGQHESLVPFNTGGASTTVGFPATIAGITVFQSELHVRRKNKLAATSDRIKGTTLGLMQERSIQTDTRFSAGVEGLSHRHDKLRTTVRVTAPVRVMNTDAKNNDCVRIVEGEGFSHIGEYRDKRHVTTRYHERLGINFRVRARGNVSGGTGKFRSIHQRNVNRGKRMNLTGREPTKNFLESSFFSLNLLGIIPHLEGMDDISAQSIVTEEGGGIKATRGEKKSVTRGRVDNSHTKSPLKDVCGWRVAATIRAALTRQCTLVYSILCALNEWPMLQYVASIARADSKGFRFEHFHNVNADRLGFAIQTGNLGPGRVLDMDKQYPTGRGRWMQNLPISHIEE